MIAAVEVQTFVQSVVFAAVGGGGAWWFTAKHTNRKTDSEADSIIVASAERLVALQDGTVGRLSLDVDLLRSELAVLRIEKNTLSVEVASLRDESTRKTGQITALIEHVALLERELSRLGGNLPPRPAFTPPYRG